MEYRHTRVRSKLSHHSFVNGCTQLMCDNHSSQSAAALLIRSSVYTVHFYTHLLLLCHLRAEWVVCDTLLQLQLYSAHTAYTQERRSVHTAHSGTGEFTPPTLPSCSTLMLVKCLSSNSISVCRRAMAGTVVRMVTVAWSSRAVTSNAHSHHPRCPHYAL